MRLVADDRIAAAVRGARGATALRAIVPPPLAGPQPLVVPVSRSPLPARFTLPFGTQTEALQNALGAQSVSALQVVVQAAAAQR